MKRNTYRPADANAAPLVGLYPGGKINGGPLAKFDKGSGTPVRLATVYSNK